MTLPNRSIALAGQDNLRDLGGYLAQGGRTIRWGQVFRSGELSRLTDDDVERLAQLGLRTVVDLRGADEVSKNGADRLPAGAVLKSIPIEPGNLMPVLAPAFMSGDFSLVPEQLLQDINRDYVRNWCGQLDALLRLVAEPSNRPVLFHCTHGKDRAGIGAAVVLSALGVAWDSVMADYLLTNQQRRRAAEAKLASMREVAARQRGLDPEQIDMARVHGLVLVDEAYLGAAHAEMASAFGGVDGFLRDGLGWSGADLAGLQDGLLQAAARQ